MKKSLLVFGLIALTITIGIFVKHKFYDKEFKLPTIKTNVLEMDRQGLLKNGDIIFQTSLSNQSKAIQVATNSKFSHCGLIYKEGNNFFVFEAIQPVKKTPLDNWIARGENGKFVIKRLKAADQILNEATLLKMKQIGDEFKGKNYDLTFEWTDSKIYCSELIWKVYKRATGIEVGKLQKLSEFDLTNEAVKNIMTQRYGSKIPLNETVISPVSIFNSEFLTTIKAN